MLVPLLSPDMPRFLQLGPGSSNREGRLASAIWSSICLSVSEIEQSHVCPWCLMSTAVYLSNVEADVKKSNHWGKNRGCLFRRYTGPSSMITWDSQLPHLPSWISPRKNPLKTCWIRLTSFSQPEKKNKSTIFLSLKKKTLEEPHGQIDLQHQGAPESPLSNIHDFRPRQRIWTFAKNGLPIPQPFRASLRSHRPFDLCKNAKVKMWHVGSCYLDHVHCPGIRTPL